MQSLESILASFQWDLMGKNKLTNYKYLFWQISSHAESIRSHEVFQVESFYYRFWAWWDQRALGQIGSKWSGIHHILRALGRRVHSSTHRDRGCGKPLWPTGESSSQLINYLISRCSHQSIHFVCRSFLVQSTVGGPMASVASTTIFVDTHI